MVMLISVTSPVSAYWTPPEQNVGIPEILPDPDPGYDDYVAPPEANIGLPEILPDPAPGTEPTKPENILVSSVILSRKELSLEKATSFSLTATVYPDLATNKNVTWTSSDTSIATVDQNGCIKALKAGTTTITVKATDGSNKSATCNVTVKVSVNDIKLNNTACTLVEGNDMYLNATVYPSDASDKGVKWSTSDSSIATVNQNGYVKALKAGTVVIKATAAGNSRKSASCTITVKAPEVLASGIKLNQTNVTLPKNEKLQLSYSFINNPTNRNVTWTSSNNSIVSVDSNGMISAKAEGTATITCKAADKSGVTATCKVTVTRAKPSVYVSSISINDSGLVLNPGQTHKMNFTVYPSNATYKEVKWTSSNTSVVSVDQNGNIKALKAGSATITAASTDGSNKSASCRITVRIPVSSIRLDKTSYTVTEGNKFPLRAAVYPSNATDKTVKWTSSNSSIATVDQNGVVTAIKPGSCYIRATAGSYTSSCKVTVKAKVVTVSYINMVTTSSKYYVGDSIQLYAYAVPSNATNPKLKWSTSDSRIATVSQDGVVKGISKGTVTIKVSSTDGSNKSVTCKMTFGIKVSNISFSSYSIEASTGTTYQLYPTIHPSNATDRELTWTSSNTNVASVDQNGCVTLKNPGTANIGVRAATGGTTYITFKVIGSSSIPSGNVTVNISNSVPSSDRNTFVSWVNSMPYALKKHIKSVNVVDNMRDYSIDGSDASGLTVNGNTIYINSKKLLSRKGSLYHEAGHVLDYVMRYSSTSTWESIRRSEWANAGYYSTANESFAEAVSYYFVDGIGGKPKSQTAIRNILTTGDITGQSSITTDVTLKSEMRAIWILSGPSADATSLGFIPVGGSITSRRMTANKQFYIVSYKGQTGYVQASAVDLIY